MVLYYFRSWQSALLVLWGQDLAKVKHFGALSISIENIGGKIYNSGIS